MDQIRHLYLNTTVQELTKIIAAVLLWNLNDPEAVTQKIT